LTDKEGNGGTMSEREFVRGEPPGTASLDMGEPLVHDVGEGLRRYRGVLSRRWAVPGLLSMILVVPLYVLGEEGAGGLERTRASRRSAGARAICEEDR